MTAIEVTAEELQAGKLTSDHLEQAVRAVQEEGYVVLNDVVSLDHISILREKLLEDLPRFLAREDAPFNFNRGNVQQDPPPFEPYLFRDVLVNEFAIEVTHALLGDGVKNGYYSGNTAMPNSTSRQPPHADSGQLWPGLKEATPPYGLVVNVPLVDMSAKNGSTEIWPGTHRDTSVFYQHGDIKVASDQLEARRAVFPPLQPTVGAGSILIRDIRMWHAGMPNHTDVPRPMIAMIHWVAWWADNDLPTFSKTAESFLKHPVLTTRARYADGEIDYIHKSQAFDFKK